MKKIKVRRVYDHWTCGDGCCDNYRDTSFVTMDNGEEFEVETTTTNDDMYIMILAKLGYEVEEDN